MKTTENKRRQFLQLGLGATAGILTAGIGCKNANTETAQASTSGCNATPEQDLGPFYPNKKNGDGDVDLTIVQGKKGQAEGEVILVRGSVTDENCQPIEGVLVEIWQANRHGRYSHEGDTNNDNPLDPNFEGWGEMATGPAGDYGFKTIKPGSYAIGEDEWRTPHIHFRVSRRGYHEVVTQMYFEGEKLNETDSVLAESSEEEQSQLILTPGEGEGGIPVFKFNLSLRKVATLAERNAALDAFAGKYDLLEEGEAAQVLTFRRDGNQLFHDLPDYTSVELKPDGKDEFLAKPIYRRFAFQRSTNGSVESVTLTTTSKVEEMTPSVAMKL